MVIYTMLFRKSTEQGNFNALGCLPLPSSFANDHKQPSDIIPLIEGMPESLCSAEDLCEFTKHDPELPKVILDLQSGSYCRCQWSWRLYINMR